MSFTVQSFSKWCARRTCQFVGAGGALAIAAGTLFSGSSAVAADDVVITYGVFNRSVSVESLRTLVETGETTSTLDFLFGLMNVTSEQARSVLQQDIAVSVTFLDDVFYSLPGEFVLFQLNEVFYNRGRVAKIQSLRSALTLSASGDGNITLLEFFENYPNRKLYVDGALLAEVASEAADFVERTGRSLAVPIAIIKDVLNSVVCDCGPQSSTFSEETDEFVLR
ncbi:MAG: alpha/beta hydrolase [Geitlerinemataceae cyanobacterium]